ncbi:MAG: GIY-YIG nuclease family protein [Halobacteriales archaeon]|nr:GIY-YIG nuclease family protein [Halobacteriales archaeon]
MTDHWVYILRCADGTLYTGYTTDPKRRVEEHNAGEGAKYTRGRTPVTLCYTERYDSKSAALSREYEIKQLGRAAKEQLIDRQGDADEAT